MASGRSGRWRLVPGLFAWFLAGAAPADDACTPVVGEGVPRLDYRVVADYPHRTDAFTQGLVWWQGRLVEGTGLYGRSTLRLLDGVAGAVVAERPLSGRYFGEGVAAHGGELYQLTWRAGVVFRYHGTSLEPRAPLRYHGEGWGLTGDGTRLLMSDGSDRLRWRDPGDFRVLGEVRVHAGPRSVTRLNELEWVDGTVYANVWLTDCVVRIDPDGGGVTAVLDLAPLRPRMPRLDALDAVANGIAYRDDRATLLVTGKLWPRLFELALD